MTDQKYPKTLVRDAAKRTVENAVQEVRLRHDGWRTEDEPPVRRSDYLPPPAAREDAAADTSDASTADTGSEPAAAVTRRRKTSG